MEKHVLVHIFVQSGLPGILPEFIQKKGQNFITIRLSRYNKLHKSQSFLPNCKFLLVKVVLFNCMEYYYVRLFLKFPLQFLLCCCLARVKVKGYGWQQGHYFSRLNK